MLGGLFPFSQQWNPSARSLIRNRGVVKPICVIMNMATGLELFRATYTGVYFTGRIQYPDYLQTLACWKDPKPKCLQIWTTLAGSRSNWFHNLSIPNPFGRVSGPPNNSNDTSYNLVTFL
jgi:hypothetical protein